MKKILISILMLVAGSSLFAQNSYNWDLVDTLLSQGKNVDARPIVCRYRAQAERAGNGLQQLNAAFYLTAIDYAMNPSPADSAIARYRLLCDQLQGAEGAIAGALLIQSYGKLLGWDGYRKMAKNPASDDPALSPREWNFQRLEDTIAAILDRKIGNLEALEGMSEMPRFVSAQEPFELELALISSVFVAVNECGVFQRFHQADLNFRQAMLNPLRDEAQRPLAEGEHYLAQWVHRLALRHSADTPAHQLSLDVLRINWLHPTLWEDTVWLDAVQSLIEGYGQLPVDSTDLAMLYEMKGFSDTSLVTAREAYLEAERLSPNTEAGRLSFKLRQSIEMPSFEIVSDQVAHSQRNRMAQVSYTNIDCLRLRLVRLEVPLDHSEDPDLDSLLALPVFKDWLQKLPAYADYRTHHAVIAIPMMPQGYYALLATDTIGADGWKGSRVGVADLESADALFLNLDQTANYHVTAGCAGWLVERVTGMPLAKQKVSFERERFYSGRMRAIKSRHTDSEGYFDLHMERRLANTWSWSDWGLSTNYGGHQCTSECRRHFDQYFSFPYYHFPKKNLLAVFTDKPIYRLGEEVQFCCVAYSSKINSSNWSKELGLLKNKKVTALLKKEYEDDTIARLDLVTDEFGRCYGSFAIPDYLRNGRYCIVVDMGRKYDYEKTVFDVEAYKLPHFAVTLAGDGRQHHFGQPVTVNGIAASYSGSSMAGSTALYTVTAHDRQGSKRRSEPCEVAVGEDGAFQFSFVPEPFSSLAAGQEEEVCEYRVSVKVLSPDGESRTADIDFRVGWHNAFVDLGRVSDTKVELLYNDIDSRPLEGPVRVVVHRLRQPDAPKLASPWFDGPDSWAGTEAEFRSLFPQYAYTRQECDSTLWPPVACVLDTLVQGRTLWLPDSLPSGTYRFSLTAGDSIRGTRVMVRHNPNDRIIAGNSLLTVCDNVADPFVKSINIGDTLRLSFFSSYACQPVYYRIVSGPKTLQSGLLMLNTADSLGARLAIPVTDALSGRISVAVAAVREGMVATRSLSYYIPHPEHFLQVEAETFRDHLRPGEPEQWTFRASTPSPTAFMFTLYDASLHDVVSNGKFNFSFSPSRYIFSPGLDISSSPNRGSNLQWLTHGTALSYPVAQVSPIKEYRMYWPATYCRDLMAVRFQNTVQPLDDKNLIVGTVYNDRQDSETLPFVSVTVSQNGQLVSSVQTNYDGQFKFNVPEGDYDLHFSYVGYYKVHFAHVPNGSKVTVFMRPSSKQLETVRVVNDRYPVIDIGTPESGQRLSSDDIARMPSPESVVATVAGVGYSDGTGTARGESGNVTIEGNVRRRAGVASPKEAIAEVPFLFNPEGGSLQAPVPMRQNLSTSGFFMPSLVSDDSGRVTLAFTAPESLTKWQLRGSAWNQSLQFGYISLQTQTQKELMVLPQVPRFFRQGDTICFRTTVANLTDTLQQVLFSLQLGAADAAPFFSRQMSLSVPPRGSQVASFRLAIPDTLHVAQYRVSARSSRFSDGEQAHVPVRSQRQQVTECRMLYINGDSTLVQKQYPIAFNHRPSEGSADSLSLLFCSNPIWYALQAAPHFARQFNPSNIYTANRLYVNAVENIVNGRGLTLPLKLTALKLVYDRKRAKTDVIAMGWGWMPQSSEPCPYTTRRVLQRLGQVHQIYPDFAYLDDLRYSIRYLNLQLVRLDSLMRQPSRWESATGYEVIDCLYVRSLFPLQNTMDSLERAAFDRCYQGALANRAQFSSLRARAQLALAAWNFGDTANARQEAIRLQQCALVSDEMGMYWRDNLGGLYWWERPIETQALMVDVFADILGDWHAVALLQQWLLKQRQTTVWESDLATASAICALTRSSAGYAVTASSDPVSIAVGGQRLQPLADSSQFGHYQQQWGGAEARRLLDGTAQISLSRTTPGTSWGALYYQYEESLDKIPHNEMGIAISKQLYRVVANDSLVLIAPGTPVHVGDRLRVVIRLQCSRTLDRLTLTDQRAAAFNPISTESGWRSNQGLRYYVDVRNDETRFYISRIVPGTYTAQYDVSVMASGTYAVGIATIQSTYAPQFRSNTAGTTLTIQ